MKLSKTAILALRGLSVEAKKRLAYAAGVSMPTLYKKIADNDDDLTKAALLQVISEETGLKESEILEVDIDTEEKEPATESQK